MSAGSTAHERRELERRSFESMPPHPLWTAEGWVIENRREQPDRRLNNIALEILAPSHLYLVSD